MTSVGSGLAALGAVTGLDPGRRILVIGGPTLFVAGSSVFPTGNWVFPTLTIVALSLRVAEAIKLAYATDRAAPLQPRWRAPSQLGSRQPS